MFGNAPWLQQLAQRFQQHRGQRDGGQRGSPWGQGRPGAAQGGGGVPPWAGVQMGQPGASAAVGGQAQAQPRPMPSGEAMQPGWLGRMSQPGAQQQQQPTPFAAEQSGLIGGGMNQGLQQQAANRASAQGAMNTQNAQGAQAVAAQQQAQRAQQQNEEYAQQQAAMNAQRRGY